MYDFKIQKHLLCAALRLVREQNLLNITAFGGGTVLAGLWNHRYSTDIDMFIYGNNTEIQNLKPSNWNAKCKKAMKKIGYKKGCMKYPGIYLEYEITNEFKIQYLDVKPRTKTPYSKMFFWKHNILIESIEEIIAKKIHFRAEKGNARDIFDIAVAFHKNPSIINELNLSIGKLELLRDTLYDINEDEELKKGYLYEINRMRPHEDYLEIANKATVYLYHLMLNHSQLIRDEPTRVLTQKQCQKLEDYIYNEHC